LPGLEKEYDCGGIPADIVVKGSSQCKIDQIIGFEEILGEEKSYHPLNLIYTRNYVIVSYLQDWKLYVSKSGSEIIIDETYKDIKEALNSVLHTGISLWLMYRDIIPLHASAFCINNRIIAIIAEAGTGKSTMLWDGIMHSGKFVTDDMLPVEMQGGECIGYPSVSIMSKLSQISLDYFNIENNYNEKIRDGSSKFWIPIPTEKRLTTRQMLKDVYILQPYDDDGLEDGEYEIIRINSGSEKNKCVFPNILGIFMLPMSQKKRLLIKINDIYQCININIIRYKKTFEIMDNVVDKIIKDIN
jgi:hypothetical protein